MKVRAPRERPALAPRERLAHAPSWGVLIATALGFALDVGGGVASLQWIVDSYTVVFAALLLCAGALADRIGARRVYVAGFLLFVGASIGCGLAPSASVLIAGRIAQGAAAAVLVPCSIALLNHACGEDENARTRAVSLWTVAGKAILLAITAAFAARGLRIRSAPPRPGV